MKKAYLILILLMPGLASAQDAKPVLETSGSFKDSADFKPAPKAEKALPPKVTIPADKVRELSAASRDAENANLRATNLELQIEKAQRQLQELRDAAKKATDAAQVKSRETFAAAGVPSDKLEQYDIRENPDGSLELALKVAPKTEKK